MLRRSLFSRYQVGAHVPHSEAFKGARMKNWPRQKVPSNLEFLPEQRWSMQPVPRDTGKVPRNFVLKMLYFEQPVAVDGLWRRCTQDPECVLESRRHLREVLKQCRDENWITFDKSFDTTTSSASNNINNTSSSENAENTNASSSSSSHNNQQQQWMCFLTRERFEEVRSMVNMLPDAAGSPMSAGMRGDAADETADSAEVFRNLTESDKIQHLEMLRTQTEAASKLLNEFQRVELDFVPYTDMNGKVKQMWFYETTDISTKPKEEVDGEENGSEQEEQPEVVLEGKK